MDQSEAIDLVADLAKKLEELAALALLRAAVSLALVDGLLRDLNQDIAVTYTHEWAHLLVFNGLLEHLRCLHTLAAASRLGLGLAYLGHDCCGQAGEVDCRDVRVSWPQKMRSRKRK